MEIFFVEHLEESMRLEGEQFRHAIRVMRRKPGDKIALTDGKGHRAEATIIDVDKRSATLQLDAVDRVADNAYHVDIALALTKNSRRIEWALEKMTELGVRSVTPLICAHSERKKVNTERLEKIAIAAIKQSRQYRLPEVRQPMEFSVFCKHYVNNYGGLKYLAHLSEQSQSIRHNYRAGQDVVMIVGPEGDFAEKELNIARSCGCIEVTLGRNRLRTETAAVAAVAYIHALNE